MGKPIRHHTSYLFDYPAAPIGANAAMKYLNLNRQQAEEVVRQFFMLETRFALENLWLSKKDSKRVDQIIDMHDVDKLSEMIDRNGPMILLSGHTAYYFMILWALNALGHKTAFMMVDPRSSVKRNAVMQRSLIQSADALSAIMPVLFTNEGGTIQKSIDLLKKGHTLLMLLDIPGYQDRGTKIKLFGSDFWIPAGCLKIRDAAEMPVSYVYAHAADITKPYLLSLSTPVSPDKPLDLQQWADQLEAVVRQSPASWFGWFILKDMI
ncbi:MAG: hypothetical protein WA610_05070 [Thermodesulfovibrionales bacterium]